MNGLTFFAIVFLASAVSGAEDSQATKKQDKRGLLGLGYGGYADHGIHGGLALGGYGYNGLGHGYVAPAPAYTLDHAIAAPISVSHSVHGISNPPILFAPIRVGYGHGLGLGYSGLGLGHGFGHGFGHGLGHGVAYGHGF